MTAPIRAEFAVVGSGWRSQFFLRLARSAPDRFRVCGVVTRSAQRGAEVEMNWGVTTFRTVEELLAAARPLFVITCVPWQLTGPVTTEWVRAGVPVLAETPPAADLAGLTELWEAVGGTGLVQVAEQYLRMPAHAARLELVRQCLIGEVTSVQVSSTHLYHAVSMIRGLLGVGLGPVTVDARSFTAPLADPLSPQGWSGSAEPAAAATTIATLDWGAGRTGLYDFTDNQWWNPLRSRRIVIRGSLGEIVDDHVVRLADPTTPIESSIQRRLTGLDLNLEGLEIRHVSHDGKILWRNNFSGAGFSEDDLAVADLLDEMVAWCRGDGPAPYPLEQGCHDHLISLAIGESIDSGRTVTTAPAPWSPGADHQGSEGNSDA